MWVFFPYPLHIVKALLSEAQFFCNPCLRNPTSEVFVSLTLLPGVFAGSDSYCLVSLYAVIQKQKQKQKNDDLIICFSWNFISGSL